MLRVGITGGIGSGKSTVSRVFESLGVPVYYTDLRARDLMNGDPELIAGLTELLGPEAYNAEGLDRKYVAGRIFTDKSLIAGVNSLVHPAVGRDFAQWAEATVASGAEYVMVESAILFESHMDGDVDYILNVNAPIEERIARASARDGIDPEQIRSRMANQMSDAERAAKSDFTIDNSDWDMVVPRLVELHKFFTDESRKHHA